MRLFEGKTSTERNKIIAAGVLGLVSLVALYLAFGGGSRTTATTTTTVKVKPAAVPATDNLKFRLPTPDEDFANNIVPVEYRPGNATAPDPGRNIFAFYEPPPPTPYVAPPPPTPEPPVPASPTPTPVFLASSVNPQSLYAGSKAFKLIVYGDRFTPDARIYFNQTEMPTVFISPQQLSTNIPENLIAQEGSRQIIIQTPDGTAYSFPVMLTVQAPPKPSSLQYIGMIGRARYNNDTAYFLQTGNQTPFGARLNDVVLSRFRLVDISSAEVVFEDTSLGFKHRIKISDAVSGTGAGAPVGGGFVPYNPGGIPQNPNIQRVLPPQPRATPQRPGEKKEDVDDNEDPGS